MTSLQKKINNGWTTIKSGIAGKYIKREYTIFSNGFEWCIKSENHGVYAKSYKTLEKAIDFVERKINK